MGFLKSVSNQAVFYYFDTSSAGTCTQLTLWHWEIFPKTEAFFWLLWFKKQACSRRAVQADLQTKYWYFSYQVSHLFRHQRSILDGMHLLLWGPPSWILAPEKRYGILSLITSCIPYYSVLQRWPLTSQTAVSQEQNGSGGRRIGGILGVLLHA